MLSQSQIEGLELAPQVAAEYSESRLAVVDANNAGGELLELVVTQVLPCIEGLGANVQVEFKEGRQVYRDGLRGFRIDGHNGPRADSASASTGKWGGRDLFLLTDGTWLELKYHGEWTHAAGIRQTSWWAANETALTPMQVATRYNLGTVVESIVVALAKAVGSRKEATAKSRARADKLRAVAVLLK